MSEVHVTNLNDDGEGSLREALAVIGPHPRRVVFDVGGDIVLTKQLKVRTPNVIIDAADAPPPGITLRNWGITTNGFGESSLELHHLRIRCFDTGEKPPSQDNKDCLCISNFSNVLVSHCSLSGAVDESVNVWGASSNVRMEDCLIGPGSLTGHTKSPHSMGFLAGGELSPTNRHVMLSRCLFVGCDNRNPQFSARQPAASAVVNCAFYDYAHNAARVTEMAMVDFLGCLWKIGPSYKHNFRPPIIVPDKPQNRTGTWLPAVHVYGCSFDAIDRDPQQWQVVPVWDDAIMIARGYGGSARENKRYRLSGYMVNMVDVRQLPQHLARNVGAWPRDQFDHHLVTRFLMRQGPAVAEPADMTREEPVT